MTNTYNILMAKFTKEVKKSVSKHAKNVKFMDRIFDIEYKERHVIISAEHQNFALVNGRLY